MPSNIQNQVRIEEKYREVLENDEGNLTLGYKEQTLFGDNKKQYVEYMTGISIEEKIENGKSKYTVKDNDTFHFISLEKITELDGGKPDYMTAIQLDCDITGRSDLMDFNKEPTNMDAIITPPYKETTVNIDLARLEYMVMPHNINGRLDYHGKVLPEIDTKHTLDGEPRDIAKSTVYDDLRVVLPTEEYIEKHKDKLGYGQLHSLIAAGDKVKNKYDCIQQILTYRPLNNTYYDPEMIINQQYTENQEQSWKINPWKKNTSEPWLGPTPLHVAIEKKNVGAVILLISVGAKTNMVSTDHKNMTQKEYINDLLKDNKHDPDLKKLVNM